MKQTSTFTQDPEWFNPFPPYVDPHAAPAARTATVVGVTASGTVKVEVTSKSEPGKVWTMWVRKGMALHTLGKECRGYQYRGCCGHQKEAEEAAYEFYKAAQLVNQ